MELLALAVQVVPTLQQQVVQQLVEDALASLRVVALQGNAQLISQLHARATALRLPSRLQEQLAAVLNP
jgi:hypothetical protein